MSGLSHFFIRGHKRCVSLCWRKHGLSAAGVRLLAEPRGPVCSECKERAEAREAEFARADRQRQDATARRTVNPRKRVGEALKAASSAWREIGYGEK